VGRMPRRQPRVGPCYLLRVLALAFASFVGFGVVLVIVGANQADLAAALRIDLAGSGLLGASLSLGIGAGVLVSGPLVDRAPRRPLFVGASLGAVAALAGVSAEMAFTRALACLAALGLSLGFYETLLNTEVAERYGARAARPLSLVHAGATLGAVLGAPAIAWIAARFHWVESFRASAVVFALLGAVGFGLRFGAARPEAPAPRGGTEGGGIGAAILPYAAVAACYVGVETAATLFAAPYARESLGLAPERGVAAISSFWLGLLLGRLLFPLWRGSVDARLLVAAGLVAAVVLGGGVAARLRSVELVVGSGGLALGLVFPVFVALTAERFPEARGTATGLVTGAGAAGGFAVPWLTGALGDAFGVSAAFLSLSLWCLLLAACAGILLRPSAGR
jgi:MFS transporter, DHA1 family, inner membrane transport protein